MYSSAALSDGRPGSCVCDARRCDIAAVIQRLSVLRAASAWELLASRGSPPDAATLLESGVGGTAWGCVGLRTPSAGLAAERRGESSGCDRKLRSGVPPSWADIFLTVNGHPSHSSLSLGADALACACLACSLFPYLVPMSRVGFLYGAKW